MLKFHEPQLETHGKYSSKVICIFLTLSLTMKLFKVLKWRDFTKNTGQWLWRTVGYL